MKCENALCIYESNGECVLEEISLDYMGCCSECIYPEIDPKYLKLLKKRVLDKYKDEDK